MCNVGGDNLQVRTFLGATPGNRGTSGRSRGGVSQESGYVQFSRDSASAVTTLQQTLSLSLELTECPSV